MTEKTALRRQLMARREALTDAQVEAASANLAEQLWAHPLYRRAKTVYAYLSYRQEVRTEQIIRRAMSDGKQVAAPKVFGDELRFFLLDADSRIEIGYRGIPEPAGGVPADDPNALVLTPGLAFDRAGRRMGYGGGFYDRFLAAQPHPTIALCFDFQLLENLPIEAHDRPVDAVLSAPVPLKQG